MAKSGLMLVLVAAMGGLLASGCATRVATTAGQQATPLTAGQYSTTFDAARRVLRDRGFILERVDARAGVITTQPKTTAGLATPWDREQQSLAQEAEDFLERQQRVVRITFQPEAADNSGTPPADAPTAAAAAAPNLLENTSPIAMRVRVTIERVATPGRKLEPEAIKETSYWYDPALGARQMQPSYEVSVRRDEDGERRLTQLIAAEAGLAPAP